MSFRLDAAVITTCNAAEFKQRLFVICDDCFWCASAINTRMHHIDTCLRVGRRFPHYHSLLMKRIDTITLRAAASN